MVRIAQSEFGFWNACPAQKLLFLGDGRLVLEAMPDEHLDFLAMDAFSSDAVPIHLLAAEAYRTYLRHLKPDGVLAINISNRYLDLEPVVAQAAQANGFHGVVVDDDGEDENYFSPSTWVLLSRDAALLDDGNFRRPFRGR